MISVEKRNGAGNDFLIADAADLDDPSAFAKAVCDRTDGIGSSAKGVRTGADGVLALSITGDTGEELPRVEMALYQPDGGTAEMCGNAARCVAAWAAERTGSDELLVDPPAGERRAVVHDPTDVTVGMGTPSFDPDDVPLAGDEPMIEETHDPDTPALTAVDTGVPHAVAVVDDVGAVDLSTVAPPIRHADAFPEGTNVTLASLAENGGFEQRTYERGVEAETRACGTGAVAVAAVADRLGIADATEPIPVSPPGGTLRVSVPGEDRSNDDPATLRGPVEIEYVAELDERDPDSARIVAEDDG